MKPRDLILGILISACAVLTLSAPEAQARSATGVKFPTIGQALRALGTPATVPAAWSGIWSSNDSLFICVQATPLFVSSSLDTLCTGEEINQTDPEFTYDCSGTADDTNVNVTCTGTWVPDPKSPGCVANIEAVMVGTRTGDTSVIFVTANTVYAPPFCAGLPDQCIQLKSVRTRTAPEPVDCGTPALPTSWGKVKAGYR
ncbi:MAG: hypothetical protein ACREOU_03590 [Candidatus Eiseniibacteriota bacterium]